MYKEINRNAGTITAAIIGAVLVITALIWAVDESQKDELAATDAGVKVENQNIEVKPAPPFTSISPDGGTPQIKQAGEIDPPPNPPD
jgi:nitrogen fixation-related uncharacterized protein